MSYGSGSESTEPLIQISNPDPVGQLIIVQRIRNIDHKIC